MHTYIHIYIHTYIRKIRFNYIHTYIHTYLLTIHLIDDDEDDDDDSDGSEESTGQVLSPRDMEGLYQGGNKEVWKKVIAPPPLSRPPRKEPHFGTLFWCDDIPAGLYAFWEGRAAAGFGPSPSNTYIETLATYTI